MSSSQKMRSSLILFAVAGALLTAGCGGGSSKASGAAGAGGSPQDGGAAGNAAGGGGAAGTTSDGAAGASGTAGAAAGMDGGAGAGGATADGAAGASGTAGATAGTDGGGATSDGAAGAGVAGSDGGAVTDGGHPDGSAGADAAAGATGAAGSAGGSAGAAGGAAGAGGGGTAGAGGAAGGFQPPAAPLMFDVSTNVDPVIPGGRVRYTIKVGNVSTHAVDAVTVSLLLPTGLQFQYTMDSQPNSSSCGGSATCSANGQATWALGTLAAGESRTIHLNALALQDVGDGESITTSFKLSATSFNTVSFDKTVQVRSQSSSQLATGTATYPLTAGQRFTLDLDLGQLGMVPLANATLEATFAPGLTVASISDGGAQAAPGGPVDWTIGGVGVGAALHRQVDVTVDANVPAGALLKTRATLAYDGGLAVDAAAEYTVAVVAAPSPLAMSVTAKPSPAVPGGQIAYRITIGNLGTRAIDDISVFFPVPAGLSFQYTQDAQPNSSSCGGSATCAGDYFESFWTVGTLAAGASTSIDINASVLANVVGNGNLIRAWFQLTATGAPELETTRTVQIFDSPGAELALTTTANPVTNAQAFIYNVDVGQIGATALTTAQLRAHLPAGLTLGTISDGGAKDAASGDVVWTIGGIAVGATLHRTIAVTGDGTAVPGAILHASASLTYDGGAAVDNLVGYDVSVVAATQPVTLTVSANPTPAVPGARDLYTATLTNTSARAIDGVGVYLRVPVGLSFQYVDDADPNSSSCGGSAICAAGGEAFWTLGTLAAGASQMITVNPQVLNTLLAGSLIPTPFWLSYTGQTAPIFVDLVVPTHR